MLEIEQKYAGADFAALEKRLRDWHAEPAETVEEEDQYLNAPDRDFRQTGEAFRIRRVGTQAYLTYKGPKQQHEVKVRKELELPVKEGAEWAGQYRELFVQLGYRPVAIVRKRRTMFHFQRQGFALAVCLDEVEQLGRFAEVEILAEGEQASEAQRVLLETAAALGLTQVERGSYLTLLLNKLGVTDR